MKYEDVKKFIDNNPEFKSRADQYRAMSLYFGIEDETIKEMMSFNRYLRTIWPIDSVGETLEKTFHKPQYLFGQDNQTIQMSKKLEQDIIKFG